MQALKKDMDLGVPLARAIENCGGLSMSIPSVTKLVALYNTMLVTPVVADDYRHSLFPWWLEFDGQERPNNVCYDGFFPHGTWNSDE